MFLKTFSESASVRRPDFCIFVSHVLAFTVLILKMRSVGIKVRSSISAHDKLGSSVCYQQCKSSNS